MTPILDACCGSKMFWFNKENPDVTFMDKREATYSLGTYSTKDGDKKRMLTVDPDVIADFRNMPFADSQFYMVVFDPPHLIYAGQDSWLNKKYGTLNRDTWQDDLRQGFSECMRVLKPNGTLIFKWNTEQIAVNKLWPLFGSKPLFGDKRSKTRWFVFMK
ncbi:class I SAM-dependent methyltransferase [Levilactobacillus brevis]|uniref:class I SAM-dependent methyltransferase n=1 Tax=Levilactobacillus brevis TaxID=1580 RepID=UPI0011196BDD|nr:class I SAM-dependent methyltransferase [Levilactobacillus brevis]QCZ50950.1 methyltransferase [Levilactobacillus brevis]